MAAIVTLTLNPALDVSTSTPSIAPVRKLRCGPERRDPGGGGINVARVVRRLGGATSAIYPAGGATGQMLKALLAREGLTGDCVEIAGDTREDFTVVETASGREFRFVLPGPRLTRSELAACLRAATASEAPILVASGGLPPGAPSDTHARLARHARRSHKRFVLDCSGPSLREALREGVYLAKPNLRELEDVTSSRLGTDARRLSAARAIIEAGGAEVLTLTLGDEGAMLVTANAAWRAAPLPIRAVSSVGAGDSFLGGMIWALADGRSLVEAFRYAMACGSAALLSPGTELCHAEDVMRLAPDVDIRTL